VARTYLFVPPEESAEVRALGASWDADSKLWYIPADDSAANFSRWLLPSQDQDDEFTITSSDAYVAAATVPCQRCRSSIEVICIHCGSGTVSGEPLSGFTVSDIWAMDEDLVRQLRPWPGFREVRDPGEEASSFANHCPRCGALQEDLYLHSEPDDPFFDIPRAPPGSIKLTPLVGPVRLSGDEHFEVE
jgi:hypothetical protein